MKKIIKKEQTERNRKKGGRLHREKTLLVSEGRNGNRIKKEGGAGNGRRWEITKKSNPLQTAQPKRDTGQMRC